MSDFTPVDVVTWIDGDDEVDPEREAIYEAVLDAVTLLVRIGDKHLDAHAVEATRVYGWLSLESVLRVAVDAALHAAAGGGE